MKQLIYLYLCKEKRILFLKYNPLGNFEYEKQSSTFCINEYWSKCICWRIGCLKDYKEIIDFNNSPLYYEHDNSKAKA